MRTSLSLGRAAAALAALAALAACDGSPTAASLDTTSVVAVTADPCSSPSTLVVGQVVTGVSGSLCVGAGSASGEFALVAFDGSAQGAAAATMAFTGTGLGTVSASADVAGTESLGAGGGLGSADVAMRPSRAFGLKLRALEKRALTPRIAGARAERSRVRSGLAPSLSVIPASIATGQLLTLNANGDDACDVPQYRTGRVVAITQRAIVVADTSNPTGGFTDAEYAAYGQSFDQTVDPMVRANFGAPSDIDGNGKVLLFFTRAVNAMTPAKANYYVGGFFFARDLFPPTAPDAADACTTSNDGEMFYLMVPDPSGVVNGNTFSKAMVTTATTGILAHEYQHLVNASRRLYVNDASDFEDTWLDEGLSHVAEELLFYQETGLAPRANISASTLRTSSAYVDAFNDYAISNFGRYGAFMADPTGSSPYADDDSLSTRGATWSFLRYAADQKGSEPWTTLDNSTTTGMATLQLAFGSDLTSLFRDWATSVIADDVTGAPARYQEPSWSFRSIYAALDGFPLTTTALTSGVPASVSLVPGGAAYLRFGVAAGGVGKIAWDALPAGVQISVVRTK